MGRRERMKRGIGMKDRDERSRGIEIHTSDPFSIIKPTVPFKLVKHTDLRKRNSELYYLLLRSDSFPSQRKKKMEIIIY